eukprot:Hpha_TRINITY_DN16775_c1_g2::TRINITY_DN16775_c1_g2_i1::g.76647::m.76647
MKPHNVLLLIDGQCKLADFGASAQLSHCAGVQETIGTPLYMAPEACAGAAEPASDVWGAGVIVHQCVTGQVPYRFSPQNPFFPAVFIGRLRSDESFMPTISSNMPEDARDFVSKCLRRQASERPHAKHLLTHPLLTD